LLSFAMSKRQREAEPRDLVGEIAADLRCSISSSLIVEPVLTADGHLYEKKEIEEWLRTHDTSPKTGKRLTSKVLTPAVTVRSTIEHLVSSGHLADEEVREWKTRKGVVLLADGKVDAAKELFKEAKAAGDASAGYHLAKVLLDEARLLLVEADAGGVEEAAGLLRSHWAGDDASGAGGAPAGPTTLTSVRDVRVGQRVRVLSVDVCQALCDEDEEVGWNAQMNPFCGQVAKVCEKDAETGTLRLEYGGRRYWFTLACCTKL